MEAAPTTTARPTVRKGRPPAALVLPALLVAAVMLLPVVYLCVRSLEGGLAELAGVLGDGDTYLVLARSALLAAIVTGASAAAWRCRSPGSRREPTFPEGESGRCWRRCRW